MPRDEKGRFTKYLDLSLPHPFVILKYLLILIVAFPWYKIITKTDVLDDLFYNKVLQDCSIFPKEKEIIFGY